MKKILSLFLALVLCLSLCSCGDKNAEQGGDLPNALPEEIQASNTEETQSPIVEEITTQLIGTWYYELPSQDSTFPEYVILDFKEKGYYDYYAVIAYSSGHKVDHIINGTYEVSEDLVKCNNVGENGKFISSFNYIPVFENDTFKLIQKGRSIECVKGDWLNYLEEHR